MTVLQEALPWGLSIGNKTKLLNACEKCDSNWLRSWLADACKIPDRFWEVTARGRWYVGTKSRIWWTLGSGRVLVMNIFDVGVGLSLSLALEGKVSEVS
jgi:hypothetical protein